HAAADFYSNTCSIASLSRWGGSGVAALADRLVEDDAGGDGGVQAVDPTVHRDPDTDCGGIEHALAEPGRLRPDGEGDGAGEVGGPQLGGGIGGGRHQAHLAGFEPAEGLVVGGDRHRHGEERPLAGPDHVGVVDVGGGVGHHHEVHAGGV